jgi:hypothetical protein
MNTPNDSRSSAIRIDMLLTIKFDCSPENTIEREAAAPAGNKDSV